ncbi:hypothetical protein SAMN05518856_12475 [Paenibacillus sp. OK003]|nr:hypothetical protein SAMN05518856_12475 [Paenibacillus sp. OK003]
MDTGKFYLIPDFYTNWEDTCCHVAKVHPYRGLLCCRATICGKMSLAVTSGASAYADAGRSFCESMLDREK